MTGLRWTTGLRWATCLFLAVATMSQAQSVMARLSSAHHEKYLPPAVLWLSPIPGVTLPLRSTPASGYTILQKNRAFHPHILVVPAGTAVNFPNADPFFHNVFSLFDGKRFDLGLYEAGSTKAVHFDHEGVSYIFCNIHPEMAAVVIALKTPLWAIASADGVFNIENVPAGEYEAHLWVEGVGEKTLRTWVHPVQVIAGMNDLGHIDVSGVIKGPLPHTNLYGQPYDREILPY